MLLDIALYGFVQIFGVLVGNISISQTTLINIALNCYDIELI